MREAFGVRLLTALAARGSLCVGIDPHPELLAAWGLPDDVAGLDSFAATCVAALAGEVAVLKPQSAFFESYGAAGIAVLERTLADAAGAGALVLLDAKRGDIGSTTAAYARAYLAEGAPLAADAVTMSPYLGVGALRPALRLAGEHGRGVFVLAATSNPEGRDLQAAVVPDGRTVAQSVVDEVAGHNRGAVPLGGVGVVVGATADHGLDLSRLNGPVLVPGLGAQGADARSVGSMFPGLLGVLPSTSRDVLRAGPVGLRAAALRLRDELSSVLGRAAG